MSNFDAGSGGYTPPPPQMDENHYPQQNADGSIVWVDRNPDGTYTVTPISPPTAPPREPAGRGAGLAAPPREQPEPTPPPPLPPTWDDFMAGATGPDASSMTGANWSQPEPARRPQAQPPAAPFGYAYEPAWTRPPDLGVTQPPRDTVSPPWYGTQWNDATQRGGGAHPRGDVYSNPYTQRPNDTAEREARADRWREGPTAGQWGGGVGGAGGPSDQWTPERLPFYPQPGGPGGFPPPQPTAKNAPSTGHPPGWSAEDAAWEMDFRREHGGMSPQDFYQQPNNWKDPNFYAKYGRYPTDQEALNWALQDRAWGAKFLSARGEVPTFFDWLNAYNNMRTSQGAAPVPFPSRGGGGGGGAPEAPRGNWVEGPNGVPIWQGR